MARRSVWIGRSVKDPKDVTILVVDDEELLRETVAYELERRKFKVLHASNGVDAFEIVVRERVDLIISDIRMPGGDGIELLDRIKAWSVDVPVVMFITGFSDLTLEEAYHKGANAVFAKPFDRKALMAAVLKALEDREKVWGTRSSERIPVDFKIEVKFKELDLTSEAKVLNIGRGGIFVALNDQFPAVDSVAEFKIAFEAGQAPQIAGLGIVRWVRRHPGPGAPTGCGIEFTTLDDPSLKHVIQIIDAAKMKPFIPKA